MDRSLTVPNDSAAPLDERTAGQFFLINLDRVFCVKSHLAERLPELADQSDFGDLKYAVLETLDDINKQIARIDEIYVLLNVEPSVENCEVLIGFVENAFSEVHQQRFDPRMRDMAILYYMSLIESIEMASFNLLRIAAVEIPDAHIRQLLLESYDESKADSELFLQIASKYINQK